MTSHTFDLRAQKRNVFVTQLRDQEDFDDDKADFIKKHAIDESSSKLLSSSIKTLQSTLLIKQASEADKLQEELQKKREEYHEKMLACSSKEEMLRKRQQQIGERVNKFDKFIKETEVKRRRALEKYQNEKRLKEQKTKELQIHTQELRKLRQRFKHLQKKVETFSVYQKYLMKVVDITPGDYFDNTNDSVLLGIMARHKTLFSTFEVLSATLGRKTDEVEAYQQIIQNTKQLYNQQLLIDNSDIAKLQNRLEDITHSNAHLEHVLQTSEEIYRQQRTTLGQVKLAVLNLAEKCVRKHCPPLVSLDILDMLSVIQLFIQEHQDICILARNMKTPPLPDQSDTEQSNSERKTKLNIVNQYLARPSINLLVTSQSEEYF
ncbi:Hypothetical predicted protein [Paramuricea clavata]|uniref:Uncharacterized protein n=1 Tax=Paramuricea clavata TaxID=317549 RepID=A0A7D9DWL0_PARCT|nr:Hypothetical predicted protein [Paramuricea clavata]